MRILLVTVLCIVMKIFSPEVPLAPRLNYRSRLTLSRALVAEAGWHVNKDYHIIPFVLKKRWEAINAIRKRPTHFARVVRSYCGPLHPVANDCSNLSFRLSRRCQRRTRIQLLKWKDIPQEVKGFVRLWEKGEVSNACPAAGHWGSVSDGNPRRLKKVDCGNTLNLYYR